MQYVAGGRLRICSPSAPRWTDALSDATPRQNGLVANDTAADALVELLHAINTQTLKEGSRSDQSLLKVELVKALVRLDPPQDDRCAGNVLALAALLAD